MGCFGSKGTTVLNSTVSSAPYDGSVREVKGMIDLPTMNYLDDVLKTVERCLGERLTKLWSTYRSPDGITRTIQTTSSADSLDSGEDTLVVRTNVSDLIPTQPMGIFNICSATRSDVDISRDLMSKLVRVIARNVAENGFAPNRDCIIFALLIQYSKWENENTNPTLRIIWRSKGWENVIGVSDLLWAQLDTLNRADHDPVGLVKRVFEEGGMSLPMVRATGQVDNCTFSVQMSPLLQDANIEMIACRVHAILNIDPEEIDGIEEDSDLFDGPVNTERRDSLFDSVRTGTLIGKGGYGNVYRAILDGKIVALKTLDGVEMCVTTGSIDRQLSVTRSKIVGEQEVEVGRKLHHENVIRTIDYATRTIEGREQAWIILEFCESGSLRQLIEDHYFDSSTKINRVAKEIATGMAYLHSQGILHGDLSSNNVLFDKEYVAKISDFGLSRDFGGVTVITSALGTTCYMAPELLSSGKLNKGGDVYSYGILLLEMLTGRRAFSGMRYVEIITSKLTDESSLLLEGIPSDAPDVLKELVIECTRKEYNTRPSFQDIAERFNTI